MEKRSIAVSRLLLDTQNPRHEPVASQRDAVRALLRKEGAGLVTIAGSIVNRGLSPAENLFVIEDDDSRNYVVLEGNRRLAAIRLLNNPDLADGTNHARAFKRLATGATPPTSADCTVFADREEADPWIVLRHTTGHRGAGVQPWSTLMATRYALSVDGKPHDDAKAALMFLDALEEGFPEEPGLPEIVERVANKRLTTLGRLVRDPSFKQKLGMDSDDAGNATFTFPPEQLLPAVDKILQDLAGDVGVTQLKNKGLREQYLASVPDPDPQSVRPAARLGNAPSAAKPQPKPAPSKSKPKPKPKNPKPPVPFSGLDLSALGGKVEAVLTEFQGIGRQDTFPNASAVLIRTIIELAVDQFRERKFKKKPTAEFKDRLQAALDVLLKEGAAPGDFVGVRNGLQDKTSLLAIGTMHGYVHDPHFHPTATEVRRMADNYQPFLQALNDSLANGS